MTFQETAIAGVFTIELAPLQDNRGSFARTFCKHEFASIGFTKDFVQFNHSWNLAKGTFRGLHYQIPPAAETKLIRCIRGSVEDIVVDIRRGSPTFLRSLQVQLSATNMRMILIPEGCAHGFLTLEENSELLYHHTEYYTPACDKGVRFDDPCLNVRVSAEIAVMSEKDRSYPLLSHDFEGIAL
ncbi:MAG: dTDP-4-keto-6-deoxy-D-glucose epimerase [Candidatus Kapaibacterium sp.]|nr:MAG: dTDP-4-keto-6-deoxy-D-glucose epimerase [Candidatus Kapabacteria bacterium]